MVNAESQSSFLKFGLLAVWIYCTVTISLGFYIKAKCKRILLWKFYRWSIQLTNKISGVKLRPRMILHREISKLMSCVGKLSKMTLLLLAYGNQHFFYPLSLVRCWVRHQYCLMRICRVHQLFVNLFLTV